MFGVDYIFTLREEPRFDLHLEAGKPMSTLAPMSGQAFDLIIDGSMFLILTFSMLRNLKNHRLAKSISDVGWGEFGRQLSYKSEWNGNAIVEIGRFFPSSKMCSSCGWIKDDLKLSDRNWVCGGCDATHDRDLNASLNIEAEGLKIATATGCPSGSEAATTAGLAGSHACGEEGSGQRHAAGETGLDEAGKIHLASGRSVFQIAHAVK